MKKSVIAAFAIITGSVFVSCINFGELQVPEKVSIKTDANLEVNLGTLTVDLRDKLGTDEFTKTMQDSLGDKADVYRFKYNGEKEDVLSYLVHYPIYEVSLDVGSYFDEFNLDEALGGENTEGINFNQKITLPEIKIEQTTPIDLNSIAEGIKENFDQSLTVDSIPVYESVSCTPENYTTELIGGKFQTVDISVDKDQAGFRQYESIYFGEDDTLDITVKVTDSKEFSPGYSMSLYAELIDKETSVVVSKSDEVTLESRTDVKTMKLPFGKYNGNEIALNDKYQVNFVPTLNGISSSTVFHQIGFEAHLCENATIRKITDVWATASELGIEMPKVEEEFDLAEVADLLKEAEIGNGEFNIKVGKLAGWTGVTCSISNLSISGAGLDFDPSTDVIDNADAESFLNKTISLNGHKIFPTEVNHKIRVHAETDFELAYADIVFDPDPENNIIQAVVEGGITTLASAKVDVTKIQGAEIPFKFINQKTELPSALTDNITGVTFSSSDETYKDGFGIQFEYVNTLPAGNDIQVKVNSKSFKINDSDFEQTGTVSANITENTSLTLTANDCSLTFGDTSSLTEDGKNYVDLNVELGTDGVIDLTNLDMASEYEFGISNVKFVFDWHSANLKFDTESVSDSTDFSGFDIGSMLDGLDFANDSGKNIQIKSLPVYFYAQKPDASFTALNNLQIAGKIRMEYLDQDGNTLYEDILGDSQTSQSGIIELKAPVEWEPEQDSNGNITVINSDDDVLKEASYSFKADLAKPINTVSGSNVENQEFKLVYDLALSGSESGITVNHSDLDSEISSVKVAIDMAAVIPFELKITNDVSMDIMEMLDEEWNKEPEEGEEISDLLSRDKPDEMEDYKKYTDAVEYFKTSYSVKNDVLKGVSLETSIVDTNCDLDKNFSLEEGSNVFEFTGSDISKIFTNYPFHPAVMVSLKPSESFYISSHLLDSDKDSEEGKITISAKMNLKMDKNQKIEIWSNEDDDGCE